MYPPIVCFCGNSLGELYPAFAEWRIKLIEEYCKANGLIANSESVVFARTKVALKDVLDALHLKKECCRSRIMNYTAFDEFY